MTKKILLSLTIAFLVSVSTIALYLNGVFEKPENVIYDIQTNLFRSKKASQPDIKVIFVDEASLKSMSDLLGTWPWPRAVWADLLDFLSYGSPRAVLFDLLYTERQDDVNDKALCDATAASPFWLCYGMIIKHEAPDSEEAAGGELNRPLPPGFAARFALKNVEGTPTPAHGAGYNDYSLPIAGLTEAARNLAVVEFTADKSDGVFRRTRPVRDYQGNFFPVLGLAPFIDDKTQISIRSGSITINDRTIPLDRNGNAIINMYDKDKVETYSMSGIFASLQKIRSGDVEDLLVNPEVFRDSIVFIGASAVGLADLKPTPLGPGVPGVMLHVFLANNYLQNDFMSPPDRRVTVLSVVLGVFLTAGAVMFSKRIIIRAVFPMLLLALFIAYAAFSFKANTQVETAPFLLATVSAGFLSFGYLTFTEAAEKRRVSHLFTQYVSKDVLDEVLHNYKEYLKSSAGQKVELTVLFSDIRGFTTMSETTPPEKIVEMLNIHFSVMADIILKHKGTIDKYIGDAIMAFWGAPVKTADHAEQSVLAAREMLAALKEVNATLRERGFENEVKIGIGINTGIATLGEIGSEKKKNYTVVGDTVNLASRLESITKEYGSPLVFSEYTYERIKKNIECKLLGNVKVKGREQPVTIYTIDEDEVFHT